MVLKPSRIVEALSDSGIGLRHDLGLDCCWHQRSDPRSYTAVVIRVQTEILTRFRDCTIRGYSISLIILSCLPLSVYHIIPFHSITPSKCSLLLRPLPPGRCMILSTGRLHRCLLVPDLNTLARFPSLRLQFQSWLFVSPDSTLPSLLLAPI